MKKLYINFEDKSNKLNTSLKQNRKNSAYQLMKIFKNIKKKVKSPILTKKGSTNIFTKFFKSNDRIKSKNKNTNFKSKNSSNKKIKERFKYKILNKSKENNNKDTVKNKIKIFNQSNIDHIIKKVSQNNILKKNLSQNNYILINNLKNIKAKKNLKNFNKKDNITSFNSTKKNYKQKWLYYAEKDNIDKYLKLIKNKNDYNYFNFKGWASIHYCIWNNNINFLNILLYNNVDPNLKTKDGFTPIIIACIKGYFEISKILIQAKINLDIQDFKGNTALHYACANNKIKLIKLLFNSNINLNIKNKENYSPFDLLDDSLKNDWYKLINKKKYTLKDFEILNILGEGSFGKVYLVKNKINNKKYAMKVLSKTKIIKESLLEYIINEKNVLSIINHPFIVKLYFTFQTETKLFLILQYCSGGDLNLLLEIEKRFSEERSRIYISELILAIQELHKNDIIYRDWKPENIVLNEKGHCLLTDFGLSKVNIKELHNGTYSFCGSKLYLSPEMIKQKGHGKMIDWYGIGLILYQMVVGDIPFYDDKEKILFKNIQKGDLSFPFYLSENIKDLLKKLLNKNPLERLGYNGFDEIKNHKWFKNVNWKDVYNKKLKPPIPILNEEDRIVDKNLIKIMNLELKNIEGWTFFLK